jgi:hypothetical protein
MAAHLLYVLEVVKSHTISYRPYERDVFSILLLHQPMEPIKHFSEI